MTERHAVVFIHDLWLHASSWARWMELFAAHGYAAAAPGWPGEEPTVGAARQTPGAPSGAGIGKITEHYARIASSYGARPVLIGHGIGGLLALTLAVRTHAAGVIAIDGVEGAVMAPLLTREAAAAPDAIVLSRDEFRALYGSALSRAESDQLYTRWAIPAPRWALHEPVTPGTPAPGSGACDTDSSRGPTLLVASARTASAVQDAATGLGLLAVASDVVVFADRGPSLVIDNGWRQVAESCLSWMDAQEL